MKNIKTVFVGLVRLGLLLAVIFAVDTFSMRMNQQQMERGKVAAKKVMTQTQKQKLTQERENQYRAGKYFIYEQDTANGVLVDAQMAKNNCKYIKLMVEDLGEEPNEIPLPCSADVIKLAFDFLDNTVNVGGLVFAQLVDVANLFNFLDVPANKMKTVLVKIKATIDTSATKDINESLKKLHHDLQELVMTEPAVDYLKDCIAKKYTKNRGKSLAGHPWPVNAVAVSPDGTKIVSGCDHDINNLILWDISDPNNIIQYVLDDHPWSVIAVAFSPDSKSVISSSTIPNRHILWNISDLNNITHQVLAGLQDYFTLLAFSADGKKMFSCGVNFSVWDISNPGNITGQILLNNVRDLKPVVFSPNGELLVSGHKLGDYGLTVWDFSGPETSTYKSVEQENFGQISRLVFSADGKMVVSYGDKLVLWDISNLNNITGNVLVDNLADLNVGMTIAGGGINSMTVSHDGKKIVLGHNDGFTILDINNPNNRVIVDKFGIVFSAAFSPDNRQIVTGGRSGIFIRKNLYLWTLLTDQEAKLLNQIKNYNADQVRLIYQLCLQSSKVESITLQKGSEDQKIFATLPQDMQKLLTDLFLAKGWFSSWW